MVQKIRSISVWVFPVSAISGLLFGNLLVESFSKLTLSDFHVYYYITRAVFFYHTNPYSNFVPIYPYFFPPASLVLFYPLILVPFYVAKIIWTLLMAVLLLSSLYLVCKMFFGKLTYHFWFMLLFSMLFYPLRFTFRDGQFNIAMLFIYTLGLYAILKDKNVTGGIGLGVGVLTKISPALIVLYAFYRKKIKLVFVAALTVLLFSITTEVTVSKDINYYYVKNIISKVSNQSSGFGWPEQSILAFIKYTAGSNFLGIKLQVMNFVSYLVVALLLVKFVALDFLKRKGSLNIYLDYFILTTIGVIGTGLAWYHQYTILLLPLFGSFILCFMYLKKHKLIYLAVFVLTYLTWFLNLKYSTFFVGYAQFIMLYGGILLLCSLFILKANQQWLEEKESKIAEHSSYIIPLFLTFLVIGLAPWNLSQMLKEGRDLARIEAVNYMGDVLKDSKVHFNVGESNSFIGKNKSSKGYILFAKGEEGKVLDSMSILFIDPVNNSHYNYVFSSVNGTNFELKARLESLKYKNTYGDYFSFIW